LLGRAMPGGMSSASRSSIRQAAVLLLVAAANAALADPDPPPPIDAPDIPGIGRPEPESVDIGAESDPGQVGPGGCL
jgi:hypothetical protein